MVCNKKRKPVFIKQKWNHVVFSGVTILSFHPVVLKLNYFIQYQSYKNKVLTLKTGLFYIIWGGNFSCLMLPCGSSHCLTRRSIYTRYHYTACKGSCFRLWVLSNYKTSLFYKINVLTDIVPKIQLQWQYDFNRLLLCLINPSEFLSFILVSADTRCHLEDMPRAMADSDENDSLKNSYHQPVLKMNP